MVNKSYKITFDITLTNDNGNADYKYVQGYVISKLLHDIYELLNENMIEYLSMTCLDEINCVKRQHIGVSDGFTDLYDINFNVEFSDDFNDDDEIDSILTKLIGDIESVITNAKKTAFYYDITCVASAIEYNDGGV